MTLREFWALKHPIKTIYLYELKCGEDLFLTYSRDPENFNQFLDHEVLSVSVCGPGEYNVMISMEEKKGATHE